jgi:hypothetical protein
MDYQCRIKRIKDVIKRYENRSGTIGDLVGLEAHLKTLTTFSVAEMMLEEE